MGCDLIDRQYGDIANFAGLKGPRRHAADGAAYQIASQVDSVTDDRAGSGHHAGSVPVQKDISHGVCPHRDSVQSAVHVGEQIIKRYHGRVDPGFHRVLQPFADGQQFDTVSELARKFDVDGGDFRDTFNIYIPEIDSHTEGQGSQNGNLVGGVVALDVQGGISFGIAFGLGFSQSRFKGAALVGNF